MTPLGLPAKTYKEYIVRWRDDVYRHQVRREAVRIRADGCSGVPDFYRIICLEHDVHYALHHDFYTKARIKQEDADLGLKWGIQYFSWFGRWSPMAAWRYWALSKKKGLGFGETAWRTGPERMSQRLRRDSP